MTAVDFVKNIRGASAGRQLALAAVALAVLAAVLTAGYLLVLRKPYGILFSNLRAMDAATIVGDLDKKKVPYRLEDGGTTIKVPQDVIDSTRLAITSEDLPLKGTVGFELFNKSDMGLTEFAQRINYQRALQGELARTIMTMDTVDSARVHLSLAEPSVFRDDQRPPKASIEVLPRPGREVSSDTVRGIQRLVAAAVPDLSVSDVVVLDSRGAVISGEAASSVTAPAEIAATGSPRAQEWRAIEDFYAAAIRRALEKTYPDNNETVLVSAQMGAATGGDSGALLDKWSPATRNFGLKVVIAPPTPAPPETQVQIQTVVAQAAGLRSELGDSVTVGPVQVQPADTDAPTRVAAAGPMAPGPSVAIRRVSGLSPSMFWAVLLVVIIAALAGLALWLQRRAARRGLSEAQRRAYTRRLDALLDREDGDVAASA